MGSPAGAGAPLDEDERAELARLRRQAAAAPRPAHTGRWLAAILLLVLAAVLAVTSVTTIFLREEVLNTDRYVATVAPLASEPAIQDEIAQLLVTEISAAVDLPTRVQQLADEAEELGAPELLDALVTPAVNGIESFLRTEIRAILGTEEFAQVWDAANRIAHDELVGLITTGQAEFLTAEGNQIYLNVGAVVSMVRDRLINAGFTLAEEIPDDLSIQYPVFYSEELPRLQTLAYLLDQGSWLLPILTLLLLAGGVLTAPDRRRGLLIGASLVGVGMLLGLAALALVREYYLDHLPAELSRDAAEVLYDTFLRFYADALRTLVVLAIIVVVATWLGGPGPAPSAIRRTVGRGLDWTADLLGRTGFGGPVPRFFREHRQAIEVGIVIIAVAVLVLWRQPGVAGTLWLTVVVLLVLTLVELVARVSEQRPRPAEPTAAGPPSR